jgi:DNA-binding NarL/FixJ family response regulator
LLELDKIFSPRQTAAAQDAFAALSPREFQVFSLLVEGTRAKEIGVRLSLNPKTIDAYRVNLMRKLARRQNV